MAETLTMDAGSTVSTPTPRFRFQLTNHLESTALEVDEEGAPISCEEFHPYGTTSWWASASATGVSQKRYRYTGKEKDEETGLAFHGARYYASWLCRWERADPSGIQSGVNRYGYCEGNPTLLIDPDGRKPKKPQSQEPAAPPAPVTPAPAPPAPAPVSIPAPPYSIPPMPSPPPSLPVNVSVEVVPYRGIEELTPREISTELSLSPDENRKKLLVSAQDALKDRAVFASTATPALVGHLTALGGDKYELRLTVKVDPNAVIAYEEPGGFGSIDPDADTRLGTTQDLSQGQFGTTLRQHERSHAEVAKFVGSPEFVAHVLAGSFAFRAKGPDQPIITTDPASFTGPMVAVQKSITIPTIVTVAGTGGSIASAGPKVQARVLAPLEAYLSQVQRDVLFLSGHGEDYMPSDERGYDAAGSPIAFPIPPVLPTRF
jgi:RHS repeat-associated protein